MDIKAPNYDKLAVNGYDPDDPRMVVAEINGEIWDALGEGKSFDPLQLTYSSNGNEEWIEFQGCVLWSDGDYSVPYDEEGEYEGNRPKMTIDEWVRQEFDEHMDAYRSLRLVKIEPLPAVEDYLYQGGIRIGDGNLEVAVRVDSLFRVQWDEKKQEGRRWKLVRERDQDPAHWIPVHDYQDRPTVDKDARIPWDARSLNYLLDLPLLPAVGEHVATAL